MDSIVRSNSRSSAGTTRNIVQSVLTSIGDGRHSEAVDRFDDHFTFKDAAFALQFTDKNSLSAFWQKSHELFPDAVVEIVSLLEFGDGRAVFEWKLTDPGAPSDGMFGLRIPVVLFGVATVEIKNGRIRN